MDWVSWHHFTRDYTQNTSISPRFIASCWKSSHEPNIVWVNTCPSSSNTGPVEPTCTKESWTMDLQLTSQKMCFWAVNSRSEQFIITIITIVDQIICPIELHVFYTSQTINNNIYHYWTISPCQTNIEKFQETLIYAPLVSCSLRSKWWSPSCSQGFWFVTQVERMWITKWCTG